MATIDVEKVLKSLTQAEKASLLAGTDNWHTAKIGRLGIPALRMTDGPNGVRGTRFMNSIPAACFPCGTGLAATWDIELLKEAGAKMADEAMAKGAHIILGPTVNMQRSPLGGRGFESFSEDPVLAGDCASGIINGIQSKGILATIKHFVVNDQEDDRQAVDSIVTERALREIYLMPFQIALRDSQPCAFMTSYNKLNGTHCSENSHLLQDILRKEWGFDGLIMSDWFGTYSTSAAVNAGLDIEMPGPTRFRGDLVTSSVNSKTITQYTFDERVRSVLRTVVKAAASGIPGDAPEEGANTPETAALLRKIAGSAVVLLKNEGNILPLSRSKTTAVIGPNAKFAAYSGGGSANLRPYYAVTPYDAVCSKLGSEVPYAVGAHTFKMLPVLGPGCKASDGSEGISLRLYVDPPSVSTRKQVDELVLPNCNLFLDDYKHPAIANVKCFYTEVVSHVTPTITGTYEFGLTVFGTAKLYVDGDMVVDNETVQRQGNYFFGNSTVEETGQIKLEGNKTYEVKIIYASNATSKLESQNVSVVGGGLRAGWARVIDEAEEIETAVSLAKSVDQVILCVGLSSDWESEGYDRTFMDLPPPTDKLIEAVLNANPNTVIINQSGTPVTMPWVDKASALVHAWYGGNETGNGIADVIFGDLNPSGKLSLSFPKRLQDNPAYLNYRSEGGRTLYGEDIYIGYRYYEKIEKDVLFPFGYGLSFSNFSMSDLSVRFSKNNIIIVSVTVANISGPAGAEVVQVYISQANPSIWRPVKELKGFKKIHLGAGESAVVTIEISIKYATSYFDEIRDAWISQKDTYTVLVGNSSDYTPLTASFETDETFWWSGI
ncbi:glycoside hydrolase superfamily [Dipodascopsis uninucleata]